MKLKITEQDRQVLKKGIKKLKTTNPEDLKLYRRYYYLINKEIINAKAKRYHKNYRKNYDMNKRLARNLRGKIHSALSGRYKKSMRAIKLLGCSIEFLKQYLKSKFKNGMSWENYGRGWYGKGMKEWHIDHIKPCCTFDLTKPEEQSKCFNYKNLQPLWWKDNLIKGRKVQ